MCTSYFYHLSYHIFLTSTNRAGQLQTSARAASAQTKQTFINPRNPPSLGNFDAFINMNMDLLAPHTGHTDFLAILLLFVCTAVGFTSGVILLHLTQYDDMVLSRSLHKTSYSSFFFRWRYLDEIEKNITHTTSFTTMDYTVDTTITTQYAIDILYHTRIIPRTLNSQDFGMTLTIYGHVSRSHDFSRLPVLSHDEPTVKHSDSRFAQPRLFGNSWFFEQDSRRRLCLLAYGLSGRVMQ